MMLRPIIFYNEISSQLKNFCKAIREWYVSWDGFAKALKEENIFSIFEKLRSYKNVRLTFKNLAAMKIFVGMDDDLLILDTHVASVLGINRKEQSGYRIQKKLLESLLNFSGKITNKLGMKGISKVTIAKWSLTIWFDRTNILANQLLV